jgi:hypothetical protein
MYKVVRVCDRALGALIANMCTSECVCVCVGVGAVSSACASAVDYPLRPRSSRRVDACVVQILSDVINGAFTDTRHKFELRQKLPTLCVQHLLLQICACLKAYVDKGLTVCIDNCEC